MIESLVWWQWILLVYLGGFAFQMVTSWIWLLGPGKTHPADAPEDYMFLALFWPLAIFGFWTAPGRIGRED